jgi:D-glycero-alpha-D-manno-heptose-7-phosphate kinase
LNRPFSKYDLAECAFRIARDVLGHHVGRQDEFAAAFGGLNFITFHNDGLTEVQPLDLDPEFLRELQSNLMLFFTGSAHHSWTILQEQEKSTRSHTGPTLDALHEVRALADRMLGSLQAGDLSLFGALLDEGWRAKKRISGKISNPRIDHLYEVAAAAAPWEGRLPALVEADFCFSTARPIDKRQSAPRFTPKACRKWPLPSTTTGLR